MTSHQLMNITSKKLKNWCSEIIDCQYRPYWCVWKRPFVPKKFQNPFISQKKAAQMHGDDFEHQIYAQHVQPVTRGAQIQPIIFSWLYILVMTDSSTKLVESMSQDEHNIIIKYGKNKPNGIMPLHFIVCNSQHISVLLVCHCYNPPPSPLQVAIIAFSQSLCLSLCSPEPGPDLVKPRTPRTQTPGT